MAVTPTYPGLYVEEVPSGVHPIVGAATADTAFVDYFPRGPVGVPTRVTNLADFERIFGGLASASEASYAIARTFDWDRSAEILEGALLAEVRGARRGQAPSPIAP